MLLFVGILKFNISFLPIVMLALVFNVTNTVGYTYGEWRLQTRRGLSLADLKSSFPAAVRTRSLSVRRVAQARNDTEGVAITLLQDRDAKRKWATGMAAQGMLGQVGGFGGSLVSGLAGQAFSRFFG